MFEGIGAPGRVATNRLGYNPSLESAGVVAPAAESRMNPTKRSSPTRSAARGQASARAGLPEPPAFLPPYAPSWVDRFTDWVERLPIPWWSFYVLLALGLSGAVALVLWQAGVYASFGFHPMQIWLPTLVAYLLGLTHALDRLAASAMQRYSSAFRGDEAEFAAAVHRMTVLPSRTTLILTVGLTVVSIPIAIWEFSYTQTGGLELVPALLPLLMGLVGLVSYPWLYRMIRQLREIHRLYRDHTEVRLSRVRPLYAFSRVTALAAIGLVLNIYGWYLAQPGQDPSNPVFLMEGFFNIAVALVVFAWPLWGAHWLLTEAKEEALIGTAQRKEALLAALHGEIDSGQFERVQQLNQALIAVNTVGIDQARVSTWPWAPGTLRGLLGTVFLPIVLWLIQRMLGSLLG